MDKTQISEAEAEKMMDKLVWRRLASDSAYRNAADGHAASQREDEIAEEVLADLQRRFEIV